MFYIYTADIQVMRVTRWIVLPHFKSFFEGIVKSGKSINPPDISDDFQSCPEAILHPCFVCFTYLSTSTVQSLEISRRCTVKFVHFKKTILTSFKSVVIFADFVLISAKMTTLLKVNGL